MKWHHPSILGDVKYGYVMIDITDERKKELLQKALQGSLLENLTEQEKQFLQDFCVTFESKYDKALKEMLSVTDSMIPGFYPQAWRDGYFAILKQYNNIVKILRLIK